MRRAVALGVAVVSAAVVGAGCGGDISTTRPRTDLIAEAMAAVDEARDGDVEYFEVNADPLAVNLFVATDGGATVTGYLYVDDDLIGPAPSRTVESGFVFTSADVDFDPDLILGEVTGQLSAPEISRFVITGTDTGAPRYEAVIVSGRGGVLVVALSATGEILAVIPA